MLFRVPPRAALLSLLLGTACTPESSWTTTWSTTSDTSTTSASTTTWPEPLLTLRGTAEGARVHHAWGIEVASALDTRLVATLDDGAGHARVLEPRATGTAYLATLVGFRSDRTYAIEAQLYTVDDDQPFGQPQHFEVTVPPLPAGMPDLTVTIDDGAVRGDTLFGAQGAPDFWILRADSAGEIVWYMDLGGRSLDVTVAPSGELLLEEDGVIARTTWLGDDPLVIQPQGHHIAYHHEVEPGPDGGFFTLAEVHTVVDDLPSSYATACAPGRTATILDNAIVEFDASGTPVQEWLLSDLLDTHRIGWGGLALDAGAFDWAHGNAVVWVEEENSLIVSVRSQDAMFALDRATGQIQWLLAPPEGWAPELAPLRLQPAEAGFFWPYHGHAPEPDATGCCSSTTATTRPRRVGAAWDAPRSTACASCRSTSRPARSASSGPGTPNCSPGPWATPTDWRTGTCSRCSDC